MAEMTYQECVIPDASCPIARVWELRGDGQAEQRIIPDGHAELVAHLAAPFQELRNGRWKTQQPTLLCGQITRPMLVRPRGETHTVGFRLRSWATGAVVGDLAASFTDVTIDDVAAVHQLRELSSGVLDRGGDLNRIMFPVLRWMRCVRPVDCRLRGAVGLAQASKGRASVDDLAKLAGVSARQLDRLMLHHVGVTPKLLLRLRRFQNVMTKAQADFRNWADLAAECGYSDQSHLLRDFSQFVGKNPRQTYGSDSDLADYFLDKPEHDA